MVVLLFLLCVVFFDQSYPLNNGLGRVPQMGRLK